MINSFTGDHSFLSNFYMGGGCLPSVEHQFQARKATTIKDAIWVMSSPTPKEAKRRGRLIELRSSWDERKDAIMFDLVAYKFTTPKMKILLLATGNAKLEEGNNHGDIEWGTVNGKGENKLGKILMKVRRELKKNV